MYLHIKDILSKEDDEIWKNDDEEEKYEEYKKDEDE